MLLYFKSPAFCSNFPLLFFKEGWLSLAKDGVVVFVLLQVQWFGL